MQRVLELARRSLQGAQLECRRIAPHTIDLLESLLELGAESLFFPGRFFQDQVDGFHRSVGSLQKRREARATHLQHAAQHLSLRLYLRPQLLELTLGLHLQRDIGDAHQPQTRIAGILDRIELEGVVRGIAGAVGLGQSDLDVAQRVRFRRILARTTAEQTADVAARDRQHLRRDDRCDQLFEAEIAEILASKQSTEGLRHLRLDLVPAVEEKQSLPGSLENSLGQPVAGTEQFLLLALVSLG